MLFTVHLQVSNESRGTFHFLLFFDKCSLKKHRKLNSNQYVNHFVRDSFCISINEFRDKDFKNAKNGIFFGSRSIKEKKHRKLNSNQYVNHFVRDSFCISINEFRDKDFKNATNGIFLGVGA